LYPSLINPGAACAGDPRR